MYVLTLIKLVVIGPSVNKRIDAVRSRDAGPLWPSSLALACSKGPSPPGGLINATPFLLSPGSERRGGCIPNPAFTFQVAIREKGMKCPGGFPV